MNDDPSHPPLPVNPFARPGVTPANLTNLPPWHPFEGPPEPVRSISDAQAEAIRRASGEWREYLPHGLSLVQYEQYRSHWLRGLAISSATKPLIPVLPPDQVAAAAQTAADKAFVYVAHLLSQYEPD